MMLVSRAEYEEWSFDLAWLMAGKAPIVILAALALGLMRVENCRPLFGLGIALLVPLLVQAAGWQTGHQTERGHPSAVVAVVGQRAFLVALMIAFH